MAEDDNNNQQTQGAPQNSRADGSASEDDSNSLEGSSTQPSSSGDVDATGGAKNDSGGQGSGKSPGGLKRFWQRFNVYLLIFVLLVVVGAGGMGVLYFKSSQQTAKKQTYKAKDLSPKALKQLANSGTSVGGPKEVLNVKSNTVFSGTVLVRGQLEVAKGLKVGKKLTINDLQVTGSGSFQQLQAKKLSIQGNAGITGQLSVQKSLSVNGSGTFKGPVTTPVVQAGSLKLAGALNLTAHINAGGPRPSSGRGSALGAGGTASVGGSDTAGTVNIRTGGGTGAGCFATVRFAKPFSSTPHVVVTPVGSAAGNLQYYIKRSAASFRICTKNAAPSGATFAFDYLVLGN
jgi:cytoskeletal protein CcmA (bactofilin family)